MSSIFGVVWIFKTHLKYFPYIWIIVLLAEIWAYRWKVIWEKYEELRRRKKKRTNNLNCLF